MNTSKVLRSMVAGLLFAVGHTAGSTSAAFVVPDSVTVPFTDWSRADADSMYAEWNVFTSATGPNAPDIGSFGPSAANVAEAGGHGAFVTSGGNIYSFSAATEFDVTIPNYGYGAGYNTRVVAQLVTLGSAIDQNLFQLSYHDGVGGQTVAPDFESIVSAGSDAGTSQESFLVWDIAGYNPTSLLFEFKASASSMSLDKVLIDTFTQTGVFGAIAVPEPAALALVGVCLMGLAAWRRRVG